MLLALKSEGGHSRGMQVTSRSWKTKRMSYLLEILKWRAALLTFDIRPERLISDS